MSNLGRQNIGVRYNLSHVNTLGEFGGISPSNSYEQILNCSIYHTGENTIYITFDETAGAITTELFAYRESCTDKLT